MKKMIIILHIIFYVFLSGCAAGRTDLSPEQERVEPPLIKINEKESFSALKRKGKIIEFENINEKSKRDNLSTISPEMTTKSYEGSETFSAYGAEKPEIYMPLGHSSWATSVAFRSDGKYAISGGMDNNLKLWEVSTGKEIRTYTAHLGTINSVVFSPDGRLVLSGSSDKTIKLWDVGTGKEIRTFKGHLKEVNSVVFSPDGRLVLSGSSDNTLKLWDVGTGKEIRTFKGHLEKEFIGVISIAFSPDGKYALSGSWDNTLKLWDISTGKELRTFEGHSGVARPGIGWVGGVTSVAFSYDGKYALSGGIDNTLRLWEISTGKELRTFKGHSNMVRSVAFSDNGQYIFSGGDDRTIRLWRVSTGEEIKTFEDDSEGVNGVRSLAISPDGRLVLYTLGGTNSITFLKLLEVSTGRILRSFSGLGNKIGKVAISSDGRYILSGDNNRTANLWDITIGKQINTFRVNSNISSVALSPDTKHAFTGGGGGIKVWEISTGKEAIIYSKPASPLDLSHDGKYVLFADPKRKFLNLMDVSTGREIRTFKEAHRIPAFFSAITFTPDGKYAFSADAEQLTLWEVSTGEKLRTFKGHPGPITSIACSTDGKYALSAGWTTITSGNTISVPNDGGVIKLWDISMGRELKTFKERSVGVTAIAFSHDGKYALSGNRAGDIKLWEIATGNEIRTIKGHRGTINSVSFSPDGRYLISSGDDSTIRLWDLNESKEIVQFVSFEDGEWIVITPEGYYNSSFKGHEYLNVRVGINVYNINQFYDVFYRPDIVAAKLSGGDISSLITLTIDDAIQMPPPTLGFTSLLSDVDLAKFKICYQVKSTGGGIGEVRLFHNGKLIQSDGYYREVARSMAEKTQIASLNSKAIYEDMRSVLIKNKGDAIPISSNTKGNIFEDCKDVEAIPGENEVSVTAFNGNNTVQSYVKTINFNSNIKPEDPNLYIIAIGTDQYKDTKINLKYAVKDAEDMAGKLRVQSATLYAPKNIHYVLLTDSDATKTNIIDKINEFAQVMKPNDGFILFVAGHGVLLQNQYYMLTHDYNGTVNEDSTISSNEIVEISKKIKSLSQLFIFDTCHAGGVDYIVSGLYDARMSVLAKKMGLHIYASASDKQSAMDGYKGNGLFTHALLSGLNNNKEADKYKDGKVTIVGLGEYSSKMTTNISKDIGYPQTPLIINFGKDSPIYKLQ